MNQNLLILGAGQYGMVAREIAEATGYFQKISFLDDNSDMAVGKLSELEAFFSEYRFAVVAIGNSELRISLLKKVKEAGYEPVILIHPKAYVSPSASLQGGCIVEPFAAVQTGAVIGAGVILSAGCVINHNAAVGDGCHIDAGSIVKSNAVVLPGFKLEAGNVFSGIGIPGMDSSKEKTSDRETSDEETSDEETSDEETSDSRRNTAKIDENAEWVKKHVEEFGEKPGFF